MPICLKNVVFVMKPHRETLPSICTAMDMLRAHDITCRTLASGNVPSATPSPEHETLYLVEDTSAFLQLQAMGSHAIGLIADEDSDQSFSGSKFIFTEIDEIPLDSYVKAWQRLAGQPWEILTTSRCRLRETTLDDVDRFYEIYSQPSVTRYMEPLFENPADEKAYTQDYIEKVYALLGFGVWSVIEKETGRVIGRAGFSIRGGFDEVELGFVIDPARQQMGFATEICTALLQYGRQILEFPRIQAFVKEDNKVSIHLLEKLGFYNLESIEIEEDIYGNSYEGGKGVQLHKARFGSYLRMVWEPAQVESV